MSQDEKNGMNGMSRRGFLGASVGAVVAVGVGLGCNSAEESSVTEGVSGGGTAPAPGTVIHVHDAAATSWDFGATSSYAERVDQSHVDAMFENAILALTGAGSMANAWRLLIPGYSVGKKFAIKVNFNNCRNGSSGSNIDALIQPVNAVIRSLIALGAAPADIVVYDCTNGMHVGSMPQALFIQRCAYSGVRFAYTGQDTAPHDNTFSATESVTFRQASAGPRPLARVLVDSDYLINVPIVKVHGGQVVTLGFKHHFGSINGCNNLHSTTNPMSNPNSLVDLFMSRHISGKTVLTVGDCLYGNWRSVSGAPPKWLLFGNAAPNSLIVSADPVSADSVMCDLLDAEIRRQGQTMGAGARNYLSHAETQGLGVFEAAPASGLTSVPLSGYSKIHYVYRESKV